MLLGFQHHRVRRSGIRGGRSEEAVRMDLGRRTAYKDGVSDGDRNLRNRSLLLSALISTTALIVAAVHLLWPAVRIDAITLGLLVLAVVPWLGPLFKSIQLPGGWKFEFQELKREVTEKRQEVAALAGRVEQMERLVFTGKTTPRFQETVRETLGALHAYFESIGANLPHSHPPSVHVDENAGELGYYEENHNRIVIGSKAMDNSDLVLRQYTFHVLVSLVEGPDDELNSYVKSALATYFPCSFKDSPSLGLSPQEAANEERRTGRPYLHNLDHQRRFSQDQFCRLLKSGDLTARIWTIGCLWGGALWEIRGALGHERADRTFLAAWVSMKWKANDRPGMAWIGEIADALDDRSRRTAIEIFEHRGFVTH